MSGVRIEDADGLGQVLVATKDYAIGEIVLQESPVLVFSHSYTNAYANLLRAFLAASMEDQERVLGMYHMPVTLVTEKHRLIRNEAYSLSLLREFSALSEEIVHKIILISNTNCHQYRGKDTYYECKVGLDNSSEVPSALFPLASKAAHSCDPNVTYSSRYGPFLRYLAIRPIRAGEQITFSYIDSLYSKPRSERRTLLQDDKDFYCRCQRCAAEDDTRGLYCFETGCSGVCFRSDDELEPWRCAVCNFCFNDKDYESKIDEETSLNRELDGAFETATKTRDSSVPSIIQSIMDLARKDLSPTHFIVVKALQLFSTWYASQVEAVQHACDMTGRKSIPCPFGPGSISPMSCRLESANFLIEAIKIRQCIAAKCLLGTCDYSLHPPLNDCQQDAFWAMQDLITAGEYSSKMPASARKLAAHYLPLFRLIYGCDDCDVLKFESLGLELSPSSDISTKESGRRKKTLSLPSAEDLARAELAEAALIRELEKEDENNRSKKSDNKKGTNARGNGGKGKKKK